MNPFPGWAWRPDNPGRDWHPAVARMVAETCTTCEHCATPVRVMEPPTVLARGWFHPAPFTDDDGDPAVAWHDHQPALCRDVRAQHREELTAWTREPLPRPARSPAPH